MSSTLEKALEVLDQFLVKKRMTVAEIADELNQPTSTMYRYVEVLCKKGYLTEDEQRGYYSPGFKILLLSKNVLNNVDVVNLARSAMRELRDQTGETVVQASLYGTKAIYLAQYEGTYILRATYEPYRIMPLHVGASSKILMAHLPEDEIDRIIEREGLTRFTINTITDPERLKEHLREIKQKGYAYSTEEVDYGTRGVASPIFNAKKEILASISISGPTQRLDDFTMEKYRDLVIEAGKHITEKVLGKSH